MAIDVNIPSQVKNYANLAAFPATGALKTIYIAEDTNKTYRWTGSAYVEISGADFSGYVPTSRTLTINGTTQDLSADRTFTISTGITIGTTAITSGTVGRVLFEGTGNVVQESDNLFWDSTNNRLGIGTSSPLSIIHSAGSVTASGTIARANYLNNTLVAAANNDVLVGLDITPTFNLSSFPNITTLGMRLVSNTNFSIIRMQNTAGNIDFGVGNSTLYFDSKTFATDFFVNSANRLRIATTGNLLIGTTTDAGFRLDVNGTARIVGQLSSGASGSNGSIGVRRTSDGGIVGSFYTDGAQTIVKEHTGTGGVLLNGFDTTSLKWMGNASQPRVGIGFNGTISATCHIKGAFATSATSSMLIENSAATELFRVRDNGNIGINTTTDAGYKLDVNGTARVSGLLTTLLGVNLSGWYLYANGTSNASLFGGSNWIFDTVGAGGYRFRTAGNVDRLRIESNGNVLINTTTDVASSKLTIESTTQGFLPPRMTTTQRNAIASPATGLQVYDTTLNRPCFYDGTTWITL